MPFRTNACFAPLLSDSAVRELFSTEATLAGMLDFERALTAALAATGAVDQSAADAALAAMDSFRPDMSALAAGVLRDGLPVPEWTRQLKSHAGDRAAAAIHVGATSQDLLDTCQSLALRQVNMLLRQRMIKFTGELQKLVRTFGHQRLMGRTRMQAALPITVGDRVALWLRPFEHHLRDLEQVAPLVEVLQFAGPVGLRNMPDGKADLIAKAMAEELGLAFSPNSWHTNRESLVSYGQLLSRVTGTLGKFGQDMALMAQQGVDEVQISGGGSSSAMPHKQNPVLAETLIAFAGYNAAQSGGLAQVLVHEQERSGAMWTLEWLFLPAMAETAAAALSTSIRLAGQINGMGHPGRE